MPCLKYLGYYLALATSLAISCCSESESSVKCVYSKENNCTVDQVMRAMRCEPSERVYHGKNHDKSVNSLRDNDLRDVNSVEFLESVLYETRMDVLVATEVVTLDIVHDFDVSFISVLISVSVLRYCLVSPDC